VLREADSLEVDMGTEDGLSGCTSQAHLGLGGGFSDRLELALRKADRKRRRHQIARWLANFVPLVLLAIPILAWHLTVASPGGPHAVISSLAWLTFVLDVGVHTNQSLLSYLGLQLLPSVVGILLLLLVTGWLLSRSGGET
jgi:hypothetical protein